MTVESYYAFKGASHIGNAGLSTILAANFKYFLDWSFLRIGAWQTIARTNQNIGGGDLSRLTLVKDRLYTDGQIWQSCRKDWVWESGIDYIGISGGAAVNPVATPTIYIAGVAQSSSLYNINYPLGRVVFTTAIATSSVVQAAYSFRNIQTVVANDVPWWRELQYNSFKAESTFFSQADNGDWVIGGNHRIQLPLIVIEVIPTGRSEGYELGSPALKMVYNIMFHILSENRDQRDRLKDILLGEAGRGLKLFDNNAVAAAGAFPLDYRGYKTNSNNYPDLVDDYEWKKCFITDAVSAEIGVLHTNLFEATVQFTCETIVGKR